jgi:hypothetical protein
MDVGFQFAIDMIQQLHFEAIFFGEKGLIFKINPIYSIQNIESRKKTCLSNSSSPSAPFTFTFGEAILKVAHFSFCCFNRLTHRHNKKNMTSTIFSK